MMRIAYVLLYYPYPSETFVAGEVARLRSLGFAIDVCALAPMTQWYGVRVELPQGESVRRPVASLSADFWRSQIGWLTTKPREYLRVLRWALMAGSRNPVEAGKQVVVFLRAANLAWQLRGEGIEVVHSHFASLPSLGGLVVSRLLGKPFTFTAHAYDLYQRPALVPLLARKARRVVAISRANRKRLLDLCPDLPGDRVEVIHIGVDIARFAPTVRAASPGEHIRILTVARLVPKKGHRVLLQACRRLLELGQSFECDIVGDGPLLPELERLVQEHGLVGRVRFTGHLEPDVIAELLRLTDIFVLPCRIDSSGDRDGIPVSLMEAMATEIPVVTTPVSGIPELVTHGVNGLLVPPDDALALADALMALGRNQWMRRSLGRRARRTVSASFNALRSARAMAAFFRRAAGEPSAFPVPVHPAEKSPTNVVGNMEQQL